jgi:FSR family fosmidomycin resistance protein-like MFS transporter
MIPMSAEVSLAAPETRAAAGAVRRGAGVLVLLALGHFFVDLYSGALGALQPALVERLGLSLTQAGILGGVFVVSSSVMQPAYGFLSDRYHTKLFAALAPAVAGIGISALGLAPSYAWLLALVILAGAGVAAFHPQASSAVAALSAERRGGWMAAFISSGTLGLSLGPACFSAIAAHQGLPGIYWAAAPGIAVTLLLLARLPAPGGYSRRRGFDWEPLGRVWKPLAILYLLVFLRSVVQITFAQFLPLYLTRERGFDFSTASYALTLYLASGALGGFIGGHLADRFGGKTVILLSMAGCLPFLLLFFLAQGRLALLGLALGGLTLLFTIPVNVVMGQELVPSQAGTVSALMMGFAWGMAGMIFIPLVGWASDLLSMHRVLMMLLAFPALGFALALKLK